MSQRTRQAGDVLDTPAIERHTQRVLALVEKQRQAETKVAYVVADIGDELIATKDALKNAPDKTAWLRWLSGHVHFSVQSADNFMRVARLRR